MLRVNDTLKKKLSSGAIRRRFSFARVSGGPSSAAQTAPDDVLDEVFAKLDDQKTLRSCTLVCRSWYPASSRALVRKVTIAEKPHSFWSLKRKKSSLKRLGTHVEASPWITTSLHTLVLTGGVSLDALHSVVASLGAMRVLSFIDAWFTDYTDKRRVYGGSNRVAHLHILSIQRTRAPGAGVSFLTPHIFEPLVWFEHIAQLELHGNGWDMELLPDLFPTARTRVSALRLTGLGSLHTLHAVLPMLRLAIVADSVDSVSFQPPTTMIPWAIVLPRTLFAFGQGVRMCTLHVDLWSREVTEDLVPRLSPTAATEVIRDNCLGLPFAPGLQHIRLRFDIKTKYPTRLRLLRDMWRYCMMGLTLQTTVAVLELQFRVKLLCAADVSVFLDAVDWSSLDRLAYTPRRDLPMIKLGFFWEGLSPDHVPSYRDVIRAAVSSGTRARLIFSVGKRVS